jgi:hypothetical protein
MITSFPLWVIPLVITIISLFWAIYCVDDGGGFFSGLGNILALVPALFISMIAWIIYAVLK